LVLVPTTNPCIIDDLTESDYVVEINTQKQASVPSQKCANMNELALINLNVYFKK
jgi:hypothetical protein